MNWFRSLFRPRYSPPVFPRLRSETPAERLRRISAEAEATESGILRARLKRERDPAAFLRGDEPERSVSPRSFPALSDYGIRSDGRWIISDADGERLKRDVSAVVEDLRRQIENLKART